MTRNVKTIPDNVTAGAKWQFVHNACFVPPLHLRYQLMTGSELIAVPASVMSAIRRSKLWPGSAACGARSW